MNDIVITDICCVYLDARPNFSTKFARYIRWLVIYDFYCRWLFQHIFTLFCVIKRKWVGFECVNMVAYTSFFNISYPVRTELAGSVYQLTSGRIAIDLAFFLRNVVQRTLRKKKIEHLKIWLGCIRGIQVQSFLTIFQWRRKWGTKGASRPFPGGRGWRPRPRPISEKIFF